MRLPLIYSQRQHGLPLTRVWIAEVFILWDDEKSMACALIYPIFCPFLQGEVSSGVPVTASCKQGASWRSAQLQPDYS